METQIVMTVDLGAQSRSRLNDIGKTRFIQYSPLLEKRCYLHVDVVGVRPNRSSKDSKEIKKFTFQKMVMEDLALKDFRGRMMDSFL